MASTPSDPTAPGPGLPCVGEGSSKRSRRAIRPQEWTAFEAGLRRGARKLTEQDVHAFSALTGDWHPQHHDPEWAKRSLFGTPVAHGMLVLSCAIGMTEMDPEEVLALRGLRRVTFKRPVHVGDTIATSGRVLDQRRLEDDMVLVGFELDVVRGCDGLLATRAHLEAVMRKRLPA